VKYYARLKRIDRIDSRYNAALAADEFTVDARDANTPFDEHYCLCSDFCRTSSRVKVDLKSGPRMEDWNRRDATGFPLTSRTLEERN